MTCNWGIKRSRLESPGNYGILFGKPANLLGPVFVFSASAVFASKIMFVSNHEVILVSVSGKKHGFRCNAYLANG